MDDFDKPFGAESIFPRLELQEVSFSSAKPAAPAHLATSPAPPFAEDIKRKRRDVFIGDPATNDLAIMIVRGNA